MVIDSFDSGDIIGPAGGIAIPFEKFFKDVSYRGIDPYSMDIENSIIANAGIQTLQNSLGVVFPFFGIIEFDKRWNFRFFQEEETDIPENSLTSIWRGIGPGI